MTDDELKTVVCAALKSVAPETQPGQVPGGADLRDALDLDSMDFLNFVVELHTRLHVDIPEADYRLFRTMDDCVRQLRDRLGTT